jgi:tetratricopeptide (TPR) repeat protein
VKRMAQFQEENLPCGESSLGPEDMKNLSRPAGTIELPTTNHQPQASHLKHIWMVDILVGGQWAVDGRRCTINATTLLGNAVINRHLISHSCLNTRPTPIYRSMTMQCTFPDRRDRLFCRIPDIKFLIDRVSKPGITSIVAPPMMGKTWLLEEFARLLFIERKYLVGYYECKEGETNLLLRSVQNLYTNWLAQSSYWQQAKQIWHSHKDRAITATGQAVGRIFDAASKTLCLELAGNLVKESFDGLAHLNDDLKTGGLALQPVSYEQAHELVTVVRQCSNEMPIVLILDAWEQSSALKREHQILASFLKHPEEWQNGHILLGIRQPHIDQISNQECDIFRMVEDLIQIKSTAIKYPLPLLHYEELTECDRLLAHLRKYIPAASDIQEEQLLSLTEGIPGIVGRWLEEPCCTEMKCIQDFDKQADDVKKQYHKDLGQRLHLLKGNERTLAMRLSLFPRLDESSWYILSEIILNGMDEDVWHELNTKYVFQNADYPSYGHDTRHQFARQWFLEQSHIRSSVCKEVHDLIFNLAEKIQMVDKNDAIFSVAIYSLRSSAKILSISKDAQALTDAICYLLPFDKPVQSSILNEGHLKAIKQNPLVATLIAQSLLNRGRIYGQEGQTDKEIADYSSILVMAHAPTKQKIDALICRGATLSKISQIDKALTDFNVALAMPQVTAEQKASSLINRGLIYGETDQVEKAIIDYSDVIAMSDITTELYAKALFERGYVYGQMGQIDNEIMDYSTLATMPNAPIEKKACALYNRGVTYQEKGKIDNAIADYSAVIAMPIDPADQKPKALYNRGLIYAEADQSDKAIADLSTLVAMPSAPTEYKFKALLLRGLIYFQLGQIDNATADYSAADIPAEVISVFQSMFKGLK